MVCIAAGFSHHDRVAVHRLHERIDLVRYRVFDGNLLSLLLIESTSGSHRPAPARRRRRQRKAAVRTDVGSVQAPPGTAPACLQDLYAELDEALTAWGEVEVAHLRHYIAYRRMVNVASVIFRPKHEAILIYLKVDQAAYRTAALRLERERAATATSPHDRRAQAARARSPHHHGGQPTTTTQQPATTTTATDRTTSQRTTRSR